MTRSHDHPPPRATRIWITLGWVGLAGLGIAAALYVTPRKDSRVTLEERQVEALERIADSLAWIQRLSMEPAMAGSVQADAIEQLAGAVTELGKIGPVLERQAEVLEKIGARVFVPPGPGPDR